MAHGDNSAVQREQMMLTAELRAMRRDLATQNKLLEEVVETLRLWLAAMPYQPLEREDTPAEVKEEG